MSVLLKCAACGHQVPFANADLSTEAICPGCEVLLRRRSMSDLMAIPVSMALPESFVPADLGSVPRQSKTLVTRYDKTNVPGISEVPTDSNVLLANAIERLATALEGGAVPGQKGVELNTLLDNLENGDYVGSILEEGESTVSETTEDIQVLNGQESGSGKTTPVDADGRALPIEVPVLVRREAAAEAHRFKRENQSVTDVKGQRQSSFADWVDAHPVFMMVTGFSFLIALVVMTTLVMRDWAVEEKVEEKKASVMSEEVNLNDPDLRHAEREARGFLNAVGLNAARPYIYNASHIAQKLDAYYEPISDPGNYSLEFRSRTQLGERSVYYYQVKSGDETLPIVVLQEKDMFKVFWEFGACIGDLSWPTFIGNEPPVPVVMRAFLRPESHYDASHDQEEWSSWLAQNWDGSSSVRVYCRRGTPEERRLNSALSEFPIVRDSSNWVMAQISLQHLRSLSTQATGGLVSAEVVSVPLGSWLPEEFVDGNTFYPDRNRVKESSVREIQGLKESL